MQIKKVFLFAIVPFSYILFTHGQIIRPGACPPISTKLNFNRTKFSGMWYEVERYFHVFEVSGRCNSFEFVNNDTYFGVVYSEIGVAHGFEARGAVELKTRPLSSDARFLTSIPIAGVPIEVSYWILDTDYKNYAVAFTCYDIFVMNFQLLWVLSRRRNTDVLPKAYKVLDRKQIDYSPLMRTDTTLCDVE